MVCLKILEQTEMEREGGSRGGGMTEMMEMVDHLCLIADCI